MVRKAIIVAAIVVAAIVLSIVASVVPVLAGDTVLGTKPLNKDMQHTGAFSSVDTTQDAVFTDGQGRVWTREALPLSDQNFGPILLISDVSASKNGTGLAAGASDSSSVKDGHRMRLGTLLIKAYPQAGSSTADTTGQVRLVFQIRVNAFGLTDSLNTFAFYQYGVAPPGMIGSGSGGFVALTDTVSVGHLAQPGASAAGSGEFEVVIDRRRAGRGGGETTPVSAGAGWQYPNGIAIPIASLYGRDLYATNYSVRVRNASVKGCDVQVWLLGSPL